MVKSLIKKGKKVNEIAKELDVTAQTIYLDIQEIKKNDEKKKSSK
ncbi:HTH domain-containing protein [Enterococcus sp. HY326]|nr:HTH domain-containing protein [Enterococcus sp. HY326]